jgi:phosphatidylglycerophosphate synthase
VARAADALGAARLAAAALLPGALAQGLAGHRDRRLPLLLFALAAATDFLDGVVARRSRPTAHGAVLDNVADIAFVLAGTGTGAALGLLVPAVPLAIGVAFAAYALASLGRAAGGPARSTLGHAAGVCNYGVTGLLAASVAIPSARWAAVLHVAGLAAVAVNLAAVLDRLVPRAARAR